MHLLIIVAITKTATMKTTATMELIAGRWGSFHGAFTHKTYNDHHYGNALFYSIVLTDIEIYHTEASQLQLQTLVIFACIFILVSIYNT